VAVWNYLPTLKAINSVQWLWSITFLEEAHESRKDRDQTTEISLVDILLSLKNHIVLVFLITVLLPDFFGRSINLSLFLLMTLQ